MIKTDNLHQLINNLNPTEKRYFKVTCQGNSDKPNNYILLFNAIEQMREYDEVALLKKFKGTKFINHLPSEKNYLYDLILKTMRAYNGSRTKANELHSYLQDIQFLFSKGLYEACFKKIKKAKKLAYDFDRYGEMLDLIHWQRKVLRYVHKADLIQRTNELKEERNEVVKIISNENDILNLYEKMFLLAIQSNGKDISKKEELELLENELLKSPDLALSFKAKTFFYSTSAFKSILIKDSKSCVNNNREGIILWETRPDRILEEPDRYKAALQNYINYGMDNAPKAEILEALTKLKNQPSNSLKEEALDFQRIYPIELYYLINDADFPNASKTIKEIEDRLPNYKDMMDPSALMALSFNIASYFFLVWDHKKCIKWLQKIQGFKADVREDIVHFAMIMELIIHYETTPTIALSFYGSTQRHLTKYGKPNELENTLLKYLKKMIAISGTDNDEVLRLLRKLNDSLMTLDKEEEKFIGMEELSCWIDSKLRRMPISEIFKEKVKAKKLAQKAN